MKGKREPGALKNVIGANIFQGQVFHERKAQHTSFSARWRKILLRSFITFASVVSDYKVNFFLARLAIRSAHFVANVSAYRRHLISIPCIFYIED